MSENRHDRLDFGIIFFIVLYNLTILILSLLWLFTNTFNWVKDNLTDLTHLQVNETVTYGLFFAGALGGSFYCLRAIYQRLGEAYTPIDGTVPNPKKAFNVKAWLFWYIYRPIQGGVLALIFLCLINSNLISAKQLSAENLKSFYSLIALGFIAGFGSHELIHKVQEVIQVVFAKAKSTGSSSAKKVKENNGEE